MLDASSPYCPCQSGLSLDACCGRYHDGELAPTPEALMRSRFSAFALGVNDYLLVTWHPDQRPASLLDDDSTEWVRLEIISSQETGDTGTVHFRATFREKGRWRILQEESRFIRTQGRWLYVDGKTEILQLKPGRNADCPCGSGRKGKRCCVR
ncbi:MAG: YchJ family protein [Halomonas sp.]|uniref:YchJ family protein n=1 Tax=Halomonas sp. TaxID=1486246 RepID=UPI003F936167